VKSGETLGAMLLSEINIAYYQRLMTDIRDAVSQGSFADFRERTRAGWARGDIPPR
jgi:queuine tRNA-ribosyltransferase